MSRLGFAALALSAALVACSANAESVAPNPQNRLSQVARAQQPKPALAGLLDMGVINFYTKQLPATFNISDISGYPGSFGGLVINATWAELQPRDVPKLATINIIDQALAQIQSYNVTHRRPVYAKLRVWGGNTAPTWAKSINGRRGGFTIDDPKKGNLTFGEWWTPQYIAKWRAFQALLAQRYDASPLIRAVAVTSCASLTDEPFVGEFEPPESDVLAHYGYTDREQEACLIGALKDYASWKATHIDYTFSLFHKIVLSTPPPAPMAQHPRDSSNGAGPADPAFTLYVMKECRRRLGAECTFDNHALQCPPPSGDQFVYDEMLHAGGSVNFQTASPPVLALHLTKAVETGAYYGATAIELWPETEAGFPGFTGLPPRELRHLAAIVAAGESSPPICPTPAPTATPT